MTERATATYQGDEPITLAGYLSPIPATVAKGDVVEIDARFLDALTGRDDFDTGGELVDESVDIPEPVPFDVQRERDQLDAAGTLTGQDLEDALADAGLDRSGTADEKRARLTAHLSAPAQVAALPTSGA